MTGSQTDPVTVPMFDRMASALIRIAERLFMDTQLTRDELDPDRARRGMLAWQNIRWTAEILTSRRSMILSLAEAARLRESMRACRMDSDVQFVLSLKFEEA